MKNGNPKSAQVGDFCKVTTSEFSLKYGVKKGDVVYIAGDSIVSVEEKDPYHMRRILICSKTKDKHLTPKSGAITIDGLKLCPLSEVQQEVYQKIMKEDFGEVPSDEVSN